MKEGVVRTSATEGGLAHAGWEDFLAAATFGFGDGNAGDDDGNDDDDDDGEFDGDDDHDDDGDDAMIVVKRLKGQ